MLSAAWFLTTFDFTLIEPVQRFSIDWQTLVRLGVCGLCGLYGLVYLPYTLGTYLRFPGLWCPLFLAWGVLTVPFSAAPVYATAACFALGCMMLLAPAVLMQLGGRRVVWTILASSLTFVILAWMFYLSGSGLGKSAFTMPDGEVIYRVGGDSQQLGFQAAWAIGLMLLFGCERIASWSVLAVPIVLAVVTLPYTQSRTAMLAACAVVAAVGLRRMSLRKLVSAGLVLVMGGVLAMLVLPQGILKLDFDRLGQKVARSGNPEELYNLTGRTEIWQYVIAKCEESPVLGWGYGCSRYALADYTGGEYREFDLHHAHSLLLNVILCTGLLGGLLLAAMIVQQVVLAAARPDALPDMVLVFVLVAGITEPLLFGPMPRSHTVIWLIALFWRPLCASVHDDEDCSAPDPME
jgi:O-antigen ligase